MDRFRKSGIVYIYTIISNLLLFGGVFGMEFATDTYSTIMDSTWEYMTFQNGRLINGAIYYLFEQLKIPAGIAYHLSWGVAFVFGVLAVGVFSELVLSVKNIPSWLAVVASSLIILNPFCIEYYLFIEKGLFVLGIGAATCAAGILWHIYIDGRKLLGRIIAIELLLLISVFTYQIAMGIFVILLSILILADSATSIKTKLIRLIQTCSLYGINMLIALVITKYLLHSERVGTAEINLHKTFSILKNIYLNTSAPFPRGGLLILSGLSVLIVAILWVRRRMTLSQLGCFVLLTLLVLLLGSYPFALGISGSEYRTIYPLGALVGVQYMFILLSQFNSNRDLIKSVSGVAVAVIMILMLLLQAYSFSKVFIHRYATNELDQNMALMIGDRIAQYEATTGIEVRKVIDYKDAHVEPSYPGLSDDGLNIRANYVAWSAVTYLEYYLGREFEEPERLPEYIDHFAQYDWNSFKDEQLIFDGDTLHLGVY